MYFDFIGQLQHPHCVVRGDRRRRQPPPDDRSLPEPRRCLQVYLPVGRHDGMPPQLPHIPVYDLQLGADNEHHRHRQGMLTGNVNASKKMLKASLLENYKYLNSEPYLNLRFMLNLFFIFYDIFHFIVTL